MVEVLHGKTLSEYLLEKYSKNPQGWSFTMFPGKNESSNSFGALVGSQDEVWRLQLDSIYSPNPLMLGAKADIDPNEIPKFGNLSYGYRQLDEGALLAILRSLDRQNEPDKRNSIPKEHATSLRERNGLERVLASMKPVMPTLGRSYAEGPLVLTSRESLRAITEGQADLEAKLSMELRRLLKNKYAAYG